MTRRAWATLILLGWAVSLGWLVERELFRSAGARLTEAARSLPPGVAYYRLDLGRQQVGLDALTIDTVGAGFQVTDALTLELAALGRWHRTAALSRATVSRALWLERVDAQFAGDLGRFTAQVVVTRDSVLIVKLAAGRDLVTTHVRLAHRVVLPSLVPLRLAFAGELKPGRAYTVAVFDPLLLTTGSVSVRVTAESTLVVADSAIYDSTAMAWVPAHFDTVRAFGIEQDAAGVRTRAWIDAQGHVVRSESPGDFTVDRSAFEIAFQNFRRRDTLRLGQASAAPPRGEAIPLTLTAAGVTLRADSVRRLRVRLRGVDPARLGLAGGRQTLAGDTLIVWRATAAELAAHYRLPDQDPALRAYLAPEPLISSDDPRIEAEARRIAGDELDPVVVARRLVTWVHARLGRAAGGGVPSAVYALAAGAGDCNAQTVLFVALARAAGLPARPVAGLVRVGDRFYYHAWPEVYLSDWVAVDPMLAEFPADAGHLRFAVGALARQAELVGRVGRPTLEVL